MAVLTGHVGSTLESRLYTPGLCSTRRALVCPRPESSDTGSSRRSAVYSQSRLHTLLACISDTGDTRGVRPHAFPLFRIIPKGRELYSPEAPPYLHRQLHTESHRVLIPISPCKGRCCSGHIYERPLLERSLHQGVASAAGLFALAVHRRSISRVSHISRG